eukprot:548224-Rhodomonas_salina.1
MELKGNGKWIRQTVTGLTPGKSYGIFFRGSGAGAEHRNGLRVTVNAETVWSLGKFRFPATWVDYTAVFTAPSDGVAEIVFQSITENNALSVWVDKVLLGDAPAPDATPVGPV